MNVGKAGTPQWPYDDDDLICQNFAMLSKSLSFLYLLEFLGKGGGVTLLQDLSEMCHIFGVRSLSETQILGEQKSELPKLVIILQWAYVIYFYAFHSICAFLLPPIFTRICFAWFC